MSVRDRDPVLQKGIDITSFVDVHNLDIVHDLKNRILVFLVGSPRHGPLNKIKEPVRRAPPGAHIQRSVMQKRVYCLLLEVIDIPCLEPG
ncbi:hypothetical protein VN97_g8322 [Penicillium thymicola]|uniref:Uncharacterized protein n=1 Tax=Penicillium thymicola TaxID=293382 RepID=A0AAI9X615_PENTH|nr:hypothetical protein VN97_g8322 [Penicillium thymicola]